MPASFVTPVSSPPDFLHQMLPSLASLRLLSNSAGQTNDSFFRGNQQFEEPWAS